MVPPSLEIFSLWMDDHLMFCLSLKLICIHFQSFKFQFFKFSSTIFQFFKLDLPIFQFFMSLFMPLFHFPIFQDDINKFHYILHFIFQFFKFAKSMIAQGPFICPLTFKRLSLLLMRGNAALILNRTPFHVSAELCNMRIIHLSFQKEFSVVGSNYKRTS